MSHTVLIVEDNADIREILQITLGDAGYTVVLADSARRAMRQLEELRQLDLVLADFNLPDGRNLVPNLKKVRPELPVIVLSGNASSARIALPEADSVMAKPVTGSALIKEVHRLLSTGAAMP
jgi:CheY-like chemotaxis protein